MSIQIQLYQGVRDKKGMPIDLIKAIQTIGAESMMIYRHMPARYKKYLHETDETKKAALKKEYDDLKMDMPAVTWSGTFKERKAGLLIDYTGLICLDIDKLYAPDQLTNLRMQIEQDPHTYVCFISPSGYGLKVIVKTDAKPEQHKDYFLALEAYYKRKFDVEIDKSGKDICRLCFLSDDKTPFVADRSIQFFPALQTEIPQADSSKETKLNKKQETALQATGEDLYSVIAFTDKLRSYEAGNHNTYIHLFAGNANRKGFPLSETLGFSVGHFSNKSQGEVESTVKSAYVHNAHEHAKFAKKVKASSIHLSSGNKSKHNAGNAAGHGKPGNDTQPQMGVVETNNQTGQTKSFTRFWKEIKVQKGRGENKWEDIEYQILFVELSEFLYEQGFHLINTNAEGWQLCHSKDGIIKTCTSADVAQFVIQFTKKHCSKKVQELIRKQQGKIFTDNEIRALDYNNVIIKKDNEKESFFYFNNCYVTVTADGITTHDYSTLKEYIWASNKNKHDLQYAEPVLISTKYNDKHIAGTLHPDYMECEFAKFVYFASYNPNSPEEKDFSQEKIEARFQSFCCAIGFMLDGYKHPANRKGIFALDHKVGDKNEKNGRSGKSIIPHACSLIKKTCTINGKTHDPRYAFRYEPITADAQIVNFNDMKQSFDVEEIFEVIADDYNVLRRNNGYLFFTYEESPKVWYSANGIPRGEGGSYRARMHPIEFSDYFNPEYTPYDEFGHGMFSSAWSNDEWNRFYSFMLWCVQCYKESGLVPYPFSNLEERRLVHSVAPEFIDIIEDPTLMPRNERFDKKPAFDAYNNLLKENNEKPASSKAFLKATIDYCKARGLYFNVKKNGKRDYSNNKDHFTISTEKGTEQTDLFEKKEDNE